MSCAMWLKFCAAYMPRPRLDLEHAPHTYVFAGWASSRATSGCWRSAGMSLLYADTRSRKEQSKKRSVLEV